MKLKSVRVQNYRSIRDSGTFEIEPAKTILVGPNEAGKSAILQALQQINAPKDIKGFDPLRDYPRASYNDVARKVVDPDQTPVVTAVFRLENADRAAIDPSCREVDYEVTRYLNNRFANRIVGGPQISTYGAVKEDLIRLARHLDTMVPKPAEGATVDPLPSAKLIAITENWTDGLMIFEALAKPLLAWLAEAKTLVDEDNERERNRLNSVIDRLSADGQLNSAYQALRQRLPVFVLFSNYFRVRPIIHLAHLAQRLANGIIDDDSYDYGNSCLLKLLGFTAQQLSDLGNAAEPAPGDVNAMQAYRAKLDERSYQLNAASVQLTREICSIWNPSGADADRLRIVADGQYLRVVVEDELGVEIELDQRSEGFQWLVSFFIVFFAEAAGQHENAILLLDEPGLSLHGLKQREFRNTISRLGKNNQTIYTTHSPFLVGPDELDLVRVVEMTDRTVGTKVLTTVTSSDPAALLPLQEALGYDLAQSLFSQQRNLVLEGLTDYWYVEAVSELLGNDAIAKLNDRIALIPAYTAGKVVYFATILHAHNLKVAALLDSDNAGDQAASRTRSSIHWVSGLF